jgi:diguanylate cyclase (GGDEF)-like protein
MSPAFGKSTEAAERFQLGKILVADADPHLLGTIVTALRAEGHEVISARTGGEAVRLAREQLPWLLILDATMPDMSGYEVCRRLRSDWRFADRSVILLASESRTQRRSFGLAAGADDFVLKPVDLTELTDRVRLTQRRLVEMRSSSPLTGLPGNVHIQQELERRVTGGGFVALLYVDLDHFKAYNDHYGFLRGDEAIRALAGVLQRSVEDRPDAFLGHVGGDDFVVMTRPDDAERIAQEVIAGFESIVGGLYEPEDAARGWFEVTDRTGATHRQGLLTVSIGVATNVGRAIDDHRRLVDLAAEMKEFAKARPGHFVAVDRRTQADAGPSGRSSKPATSPDGEAMVDQASLADRGRPGLVEVTASFGLSSARVRRPRRRRGLVRYAAAALVTLALVAGPATVVMAENARPGEALWTVKLWVEDARLILERDDGKDVALRLEFAARRVGDLQYLAVRKGSASLMTEVTENLTSHLEGATLTYRRLAADRVAMPALRSQIRMFLEQSTEVLRGLVAAACGGEGDRQGPPEAACAGLQTALQNSNEAMDIVIDAAGPPGNRPGQGAPGQNDGKEPPGQDNDGGAPGRDTGGKPPTNGGDQGPASGAEAPGATEDAKGKGGDQGPPEQGGTEGTAPGHDKDKDKDKPPPPGHDKDKDKPPPPGHDKGTDEEPPAPEDPPAPATDAQLPTPVSSGSGEGSSGE